MEMYKENKMERAKKRVEDLKGFYGHLMAYVGINILITIGSIIGIMYSGQTFAQALGNFGTWAVWLFWGIGLFFHAFKIFGPNWFFGESWEQRQIQKYMDREREESRKYRH